MFLKT
jgi:hypothetical protein